MPQSDLSAAHLAAQAGSFEEQRADNALLRVFDLAENSVKSMGREILTLSAQSFPLPTVTIEALETHFLNEKRKIAGKASFEDMEWVFKDFVDVQTARICKLWHEKAYDPVTGKIGLARDYKKRGEIVIFAPNGAYERYYTLEGIWPTTFNAGAIDMTSAEPIKITMTMSIDKSYAARGKQNVDLKAA